MKRLLTLAILAAGITVASAPGTTEAASRWHRSSPYRSGYSAYRGHSGFRSYSPYANYGRNYYGGRSYYGGRNYRSYGTPYGYRNYGYGRSGVTVRSGNFGIYYGW